MSVPEEISCSALQWMWLNIKFVTFQLLEISPHFLHPCGTHACLIMSACLFISVAEVTQPCFIICPMMEGARQVALTPETSLIPNSWKRRQDRLQLARHCCVLGEWMYALGKLFIFFPSAHAEKQETIFQISTGKQGLPVLFIRICKIPSLWILPVISGHLQPLLHKAFSTESWEGQAGRMCECARVCVRICAYVPIRGCLDWNANILSLSGLDLL